MSTEDKKTDNELIAEFMGLECTKEIWDKEEYAYTMKIDNSFFYNRWTIPSEMLFHKFWDWLMPVVEKITTLCYGVSITTWPEKWDLPIIGIQVLIHDRAEDEPIVQNDAPPEKMINAVYKSVVQFIRWYNTQPK